MNFARQGGGSDSSTSSDPNFDDLVLKEKPHVKWEEVIGLDDAKRAIRESIVYPTKRSDLFPLGWPRGILLFGPPGCGKTLLAAAAAAEIDGYFLNVDAASMMSKWLGEAEKNVSKLFMLARRLQENEGVPVLLFIDEIDSLLGTRTSEIGGEVRVKNQFLTEMDGINVKIKRYPVIRDWSNKQALDVGVRISSKVPEAHQCFTSFPSVSSRSVSPVYSSFKSGKIVKTRRFG